LSFYFSQRSLDELEGVNPKLVDVAHRAIKLTKVDFGITEGLRSLETQKLYVATGKSQTMNSKHLEGNAIDVVAYIGSKISWELNLYDDIADAFVQAGKQAGVSIRWGAAWNVNDITAWGGDMESAMMYYIDTRRSQGRRPFIDGPHFELS
jgi:peptidoglycan L-alanyl-D-glutamate endopeptidase CwlK